MIGDIIGVAQSAPLNNLITLAFALSALNLPILISVLENKEKALRNRVLIDVLKPRSFIISFLILLMVVLIVHTIQWHDVANGIMIVIIVGVVWYVIYSYCKYTRAQFDIDFFNKERNQLIKKNYEDLFRINQKREEFLDKYGVGDKDNARFEKNLIKIESNRIRVKINYDKIGDILSQYNNNHEPDLRVYYIVSEDSIITDKTAMYLSSTKKADKLNDDLIKGLQKCFDYKQDKQSPVYLLNFVRTACEKSIINGVSTEFNQTIEIVEELVDSIKDSSSLEGVVSYYTGAADIIKEFGFSKISNNLLESLYYSFLYKILPITTHKQSKKLVYISAHSLSQVLFLAYHDLNSQKLLDYGSDLLLALIKNEFISSSHEVWDRVDSHIIDFMNEEKVEGARYLLEKFFSPITPIDSEEGEVEEILLKGCQKNRDQYTKSQKLHLFIILAILNDSSKKGLEVIFSFYSQLQVDDPKSEKDLHDYDDKIVSSILRNHIHPYKATHKFGGVSTTGGTVNYKDLYDNTREVIKELRKS